MSKKLEEYRARYEIAAHRVQTALSLMPGDRRMTPKHIRVGLDMGKSDQGALVTLLIEKGVFTVEEYYLKVAEFAEQEADSYEKEINQRTGMNIKTL